MGIATTVTCARLPVATRTTTPVFATLKGDSIGDVDLESIRLVGPSGVEVTPASMDLKGDRIEVVFDNAAVIGIVAGVPRGRARRRSTHGYVRQRNSWLGADGEHSHQMRR